MSHRRRVVRYIAIEEGAEVDIGSLGMLGISGDHKIMGYQPAPIGPRQAAAAYKPHGWLVVLINEEVTGAFPRRLRHSPRPLTPIPTGRTKSPEERAAHRRGALAYQERRKAAQTA
jgi:hypothetical protein